MAENENLEQTEENKENSEEKVGEFGENSRKDKEKEAEKPIEFTPLNLGNETNISDWLVNMLSGRALDFVVNNIAWAGDFLHRHAGVYVEQYIEKRQKARQIAETEKADKKLAAAGNGKGTPTPEQQAEARKKLLDKDGNIDISRATTISTSDKNGLVSVGGYILTPNDKVVDGNGNPVPTKGKDTDIVNAWDRARSDRQYKEALANEDKTKSAKQEKKMKRASGALCVSPEYDLKFNSSGELYQVGDYVVKPGDRLVDAMGKPLEGNNPEKIVKQAGEAALKREKINQKRRENREAKKQQEKGKNKGKEKAAPEKEKTKPGRTKKVKPAEKQTAPAKRTKTTTAEKGQQSQGRAKKTAETTKSAKSTKAMAGKIEQNIQKTQSAKSRAAAAMNRNKANAGRQATNTAARAAQRENQGR